MIAGLAPDGGLYVPDRFPKLPSAWSAWDYREAMTGVLELFGAGDCRSLVDEAAARFRVPEAAPIREVGGRHVLELFWGPTLSFKDHALQVVARLIDRAQENYDTKATILVATSGDTGSAAIEACRGRPHLEVFVLFPDGRISEFQRRQMTTVEDSNVHAISVRGDFDDCQRLVKSALANSDLGNLLTANSINWGRIAAQVGYYVYAAARIGQPFDVVVPTGNFGNVYSALVAKEMGTPIERIAIASNANRMLSELITTGEQRTAPVIPTVAPSMDIGVPSNLERMGGKNPADHFEAGWASDDQIIETIRDVASETGYLLDPHTAAAWHVGASTGRSDVPLVVVATAHPAKFRETVELAVGSEQSLPEGFEDLDERNERVTVIDPEASALAALIR